MSKKAALFDTEEFNIKKELKNESIEPVHVTQEVQDVQEVQYVQKEIGTTQGKKGQRLKRINMAFSDINHEFVTKESRRQGMSATAFVNMIIEEYKNKL